MGHTYKKKNNDAKQILNFFLNYVYVSLISID